MGEDEIKLSQMIGLLEEMSIHNYALYSNHFIGNSKVIENAPEYYKLVKNLNLKSAKKYVGSPCFFDKLEANYRGVILKTKISPRSSFYYIIDNLEKENLLLQE